jgi:hypothetical protein
VYLTWHTKPANKICYKIVYYCCCFHVWYGVTFSPFGKVIRYNLNTTTEENILQLLLPEEWKNDVMKMLHDDPQSGHLGIHRTVSRAQNRFYWVQTKFVTKLSTIVVVSMSGMG